MGLRGKRERGKWGAGSERAAGDEEDHDHDNRDRQRRNTKQKHESKRPYKPE